VVFFREVAKGHTDKPVVVELCPGDPVYTVQGCVGWDKSIHGYRVLMNERLTPASLFSCLVHELGHIVFGDARKADLDDWSDQRAALTGIGPEATIKAKRARSKEVSTVLHEREARTQRWADKQTRVLWPACKAYLGVISQYLER
jgi:hypothetical protein